VAEHCEMSSKRVGELYCHMADTAHPLLPCRLPPMAAIAARSHMLAMALLTGYIRVTTSEI
jgi:hypothetical protein